MRIKGVGPEYARRLAAAGVQSVKDLSGKDPIALTDALLEAQVLNGGSGSSPSPKRVAIWVRQAQSLTVGH
jgi:hypothetical protein